MVEQDGQTQPYGMSVHHMLDPPADDDNDQATRSGDRTNTDTHSNSSSAPSPRDSDLSDSAGSDDNDDGGYTSSEFESDISEDEQPMMDGRTQRLKEQGDTPGIKAHDVENISITQPAFRDAWEQNLHADDAPLEELDEDHLRSYKFGKIHASSGLRRTMKDGMRHEIDWALIEVIHISHSFPNSKPY